MTLQLPNLDDRLFEQLVSEARKAIPQFMPEWTDENAHDPGITFIELFAWLSEMQQYYLNRITDQHERKYLKLLGYRPEPVKCAATDVTFSGHAGLLRLPKGIKLQAQDQMFETAEALTYIPAKIDRIVVRTETEANDSTSSNANDGVSFYAFGRDAKVGNRLYIAFHEPLPIDEEIVLTIKLFENYPVKPGAVHDAKEQITPSATVSWKCYGAAGEDVAGAAGWLPIELLADDTLHFSRSGRVRFRVPYQMRPIMIHPANDRGRFWISCAVEEAGYELAPKIDRIFINTIKAVQQDTISEVLMFAATGQAQQRIGCDTFLSRFGLIQVQVQEEPGIWREWQEAAAWDGVTGEQCAFVREKAESGETIAICFGDGGTGSMPQGSIRVIAYPPAFLAKRWLGRSNGLPYQRFALPETAIIASSMLIQTGRKDKETGRYIWEDWQQVDDFVNSGASDRHFVFDQEKNEIVFGNNEQGAIPPVSDEDTICLLGCRLGGGERGNVGRNLVDSFLMPIAQAPDLQVTNHVYAEGGAERETLEAAKLRLKKDLKKPFRAVTAEDYEQIAQQTPGLRVARVKAIPLFKTGLKDYPQNKAPAQMTVVVVPYSEERTPVPSKGFLQTVSRHVEQHRLLTTEVHVIGPEYNKVTIHAVVVVEPQSIDDRHKIVHVLNELLQPLDRRDGTKGWGFGRTVYKGDIYGAINRIPGVVFIQDLWINAEGKNVVKTPSGDIQIPPYGLIYSGDHEIELISQTDI